ncbi:MAG: 50S ribosomal protein L35 [Clostridiales bacterium]|nr:50S ribosomal protein L35 [Clostridiales bacterium]
MPKIKTHSGAKKRFKLSKNGKPIRGHAYKSHILTKKSTKRKRNLRKASVADKTNQRQIKRLIPYK